VRPSERIRLIQRICARLTTLEFAELDLTLRQFGLPWSESWVGDKQDYCLHHVEGGDDAALLDLFEHLHDGKRFELTARESGEHLWRDGFFRLFLTHISTAKVFVAETKGRLEPRGIDAFVAHEDIEPTKEWEHEIEAALETCDCLAAFLTSDFHDSLWTDQEIGFAVRRRVLLVPVRMGRDPYGFLGRYQALNASGRDADWVAEALLDILLDHDLTMERMASAVVRVFEDSSTFADAKKNLGYVKRVRRWSPSLLRRLEEAIESNDQVEGAWGVPDQVRDLVKSQSRKQKNE
jgi:hypothetical protein